MPQKVVVIYSGGMDSFTVLHKAINDGHEVYALSFNYGQRHVRELECAKAVCAELGINHKVVEGIYVAGTLAGHRSQLTVAAGSGAMVAGDLLVEFNHGQETHVHDSLK